MDIKFFTPNDLDDCDADCLWEQNINMDDWDYMFLFPAGSVKMNTIVYDNEVVFEPEDYTVSNLLRGCCDNRWYQGMYQEEPYIIGIAYHS